jgi:hypothetical protein
MCCYGLVIYKAAAAAPAAKLILPQPSLLAATLYPEEPE